MEQEPTPILEIFEFILYLGSVIFIIGAIFQTYVLVKNRKPIWISISVIVLTRLLTIISSYFIWLVWNLPFDIMCIFLFLPAILPELILSPLILKLFGNKIIKIKPNAQQCI